MNERSFWKVTAPCVTAAVLVTRWPFRSEFLFSWDSANYALAMERIDIAAHRPHPPGYLAYVAVARAIHTVAGDVNGSLVLWNIFATALAVVVLVRLAWEIGEGSPHRSSSAAAAGVLAIASPLLWFYGEVAEIYVSEMLAALALVYTSWRVIRQRRTGAIYWSAICIPVAASFKLTTTVLLMPLVVYAWSRAPVGTRIKAGSLLVACSTVVLVAFLSTTPDLAGTVRRQFESATSGTRVSVAAGSDALERLNHNFRDTLVAAVAMLGILNTLGLLYWVLRDRRLPSGLPRSVAWLWVIPWLVLCLAIHIAKPGYLLPLLPLTSLILAGLYAQQSAGLYFVLLGANVAVNVVQFALLGPLPATVTGGSRPYRDKTLLQRFASDLQPLTVSTAATIRRSDLNVSRVLTEIGGQCPSRNPIVIAGTEPVDARRVMYYLPGAVVIHVSDRSVLGFAVGAHLTPVPAESRVFASDCTVVFWLTADNAAPEFALPETAARSPGVGFTIAAASVRVTPTEITFARVRPNGQRSR